jgi:hypothetical protein
MAAGNGCTSPMAKPLTEVIFEFRQVGNAMKVSAIDPTTNTEVSIVGSPRADKNALKAAALRKLRYVIEKTQASNKNL